MPNWRVQIANHSATALPKDYFVNTLYFTSTSTPTDAEWTTFLTALVTAFRANAMLAYQSYTVKAYNMADAKPRPIIASYTSTGSDNSPCATEVALCLSYYSGRNLPRTRGRIFLGPIELAHMTGPIAFPSITSAVIAQGIAIDTAAAAASMTWCLHSVKDNDYLPITNLWVDNAWDTQRRRGTASTVRVQHAL